MRLEPSLSTLESLEFSFNQVTSLVIPSNPADEVDDTSKRAPFPNLHHLRLDSNAFSSWADLDPISCFTALQTLSLTYNDLPSLPPPSSTTSSPFPSSLSSLSLSFNKIKTWSSIDVLGSLPLNGGKGLREVWVRGNGFVEGTPGGLVRSGLIARLRGLEVLEGSEVTPGERKDAELFYLSLHPTFDANDVGRKRWDELVMSKPLSLTCFSSLLRTVSDVLAWVHRIRTARPQRSCSVVYATADPSRQTSWYARHHSKA